MTPDEVLATYDDRYAARYDDTFILASDNGFFEKTSYEITVLEALTQQVDSWLDVACGTGYFLKSTRAPETLRRAGLDLSPAMLANAKREVPHAEFYLGDYRASWPELVERWGLTSVLWGAYALQESIGDIELLVANLHRWTRAGGVCFLPVFDPRLLAAQRDRGLLPTGMVVEAEGTRWSYTEPDGKAHLRVITPSVSTMKTLLRKYFSSVRAFPYPGMCRGVPMMGLLAGKG